MTAKITNQSNQTNQSTIEDWFDKLLSNINGDALMMSTGVAPESVKNFYLPAIEGDYLTVLQNQYKLILDASAKLLVTDFINSVKDIPLEQIGLSYDGTQKIQTIAIVNDDDTPSRNAIYEAIAQTEAHYSQLPIRFETLVFEKSDDMKIPNTYFIIKANDANRTTTSKTSRA